MSAKSKLILSKDTLRNLNVRSNVRTGIAVDPLPPTINPAICRHTARGCSDFGPR